MFAMTWSLVSCSVAFSPSSTCVPVSVERMLARAGLQRSQPRPVPKRSMIALKVKRPETRTASNSWRRDIAKCSHSALLTVAPVFASSAPTIFLIAPTHEPHAAPALVQDLTAATSVQPCSCTAWRMVPAVTLLHEQTSASSGRSPVGAATPSPGTRYAAGSAPRALPTSGRSDPYADASPTRMPPSRVFASSETTSFL